MASPVGHSLFGYIAYSIADQNKNGIDWRKLFGFIVIANLADFDYLFGFFIGKPNEYHHQFTHSIVFALIVAAGITMFLKIKHRRHLIRSFIIVFLVYCSHLLIDYFTLDTSPPFGEQLLWPFSNDYFLGKVAIFRDVHKGDTSASFFKNLFSFYNFVTGLMEIVMFGSVGILLNLYNKYLKRKRLNE